MQAGRAARALMAATGQALRSIGRPGSRLIDGRTRARIVPDTGALPVSCDVVVVGGGLVGVCAALVLAERGVNVVLCEKGAIAGEASGRAFGLISNLFVSPRKLPLIARAQDQWSNLAARIPGDVGYHCGGFHVLLGSEPEVAYAASWLASVHGAPGVDARVTTSADVAALSPEAGAAWAGGLLQANAATVDPRLAAPAIAEAARAKGAIILQSTAVRTIETAGGRVVGVVTEKGRVAAPSVVIAGGIWSGLLARGLGLALPEIQAWASIGRVTRQTGSAPAVSAGGVNYRAVAGGSYLFNGLRMAAPVTRSTVSHLPALLGLYAAMPGQVDVVFDPRTFLAGWHGAVSADRISAFERCRIAEPEVHAPQLDAALAGLRRFPGFKDAAETERWAGAICMTPDNMPVISAVDSLAGLFIGTGAFNGVTLAPAMGEALADLAMARVPACDLRDYRYSRFSDGSRLDYQP